MSAPPGRLGPYGSNEHGLLNQMLTNPNCTQISQGEPRGIPPVQADTNTIRRLTSNSDAHNQTYVTAPQVGQNESRLIPVQVDMENQRRLPGLASVGAQGFGTVGQRSTPSSMAMMPAPPPNIVMETPDMVDTVLRNEPLEATSGTMNHTEDWSRRSFMEDFMGYHRIEVQRRAMGIPHSAVPVMGATSLYANGQPRQAYQQTGRTIQGAIQPAVAPIISQGYPFMAPPSFNHPALAEDQHLSNVGLPHSYQEPLPRSNLNHYVAFTDASHAIAQQRRRQSQNASVPNLSHTNGHNRRRARRSDDQRPHYPRHSSPQHLEGRARQSAAIRYSDNGHSESDQYPSFSVMTDQQRFEVAQRLNLTDLLRNMRPEDLEAMQIYDQGIFPARRFRQGRAAATSPSPSKGLDNQNDGRPDPKETEELTVNMECKACMTQLVDTVLLPCGHAILCRWCAAQHMPSSRGDQTRPKGNVACPLCRKPVKQKLRIYLS